MNNTLKLLTAFALVGGMAACGGDNDVENYNAEEAAVPEVETPAPTTSPTMDTPLFTSDFEATETEAGANPVTGVVRIYPLEGESSMGAAQPAEPTAGEPSEETETPEMEESETEENAATATPSGDEGFRLEVTLNGLSQGEHAWHIHSGPCGEDAPVAVAISSTADQEGIGQALNATADAPVRDEVDVPASDLSLEQLRSGEYSLHVHQTAGADHGPTVACANLEASDGGMNDM